MPLSTRFSLGPVRGLPLLLGALLLNGCATPGEAPPPEVSEVRSASPSDDGTVATPTAPLMPSLLFPGGAEAFQAWRCTPAQDLVSAARRKLVDKGCDLVVANEARHGFAGDTNQVVLVDAERDEPVPAGTKHAIADRVLDRVARHLAK